ncbi:MAG: acetylxylan esterase, partial [Bryobacteraceae bacterium]|nr:acetylxylan esterase [Bryobacteraceae bacterium]
MNRREFVSVVAAQAASGAAREQSYASAFPDMLLDYLTRQLNERAAYWDGERARINTAAAIHERNRGVRRRMREMVHGFPERCPLAPRIAGGFERKGYRVENVLFQSRPDFWVTANLYLPSNSATKVPGIISPCGHYADARMNPEYQAAYINLVLAGFAVLAFDPVGQGERRHFWDPAVDPPEVGRATTEHSMVGQLLLLVGEDLTHYRIWDGMRAIDYLLSRPEIDPERIGCAGHSGGGTLTRFIAALDERVKVAVINEGGTSNRWPVRYEAGARVGPSDVEQNLFPGAAMGVDHVDMQVAIAPRPLLALIEDYNPAFNRAAEKIRERYQQLGAADRFATEEATDPHAWTVKLRQATTHWFSRWFFGRPGPAVEPDFAVEPQERLYCTPNGSIRHSRTGETLYSLLVKKTVALPPSANPDQVRADLRRLLDYRKPEGPLGVRRLVTTERKHYHIEKIEFLSEPGIYIPAWVFVPDKVPETTGRPARAVIYVNDGGKESHGGEFGAIEKMTLAGATVISIDVRGIGGTRPPHANPGDRGDSTHLFDVETAMAYMAWYLNRSLLGMRVQDVVRAVDYAFTRVDFPKEDFIVMGMGQGALWALFAAALDPRIPAVHCRGGLLSYRMLTDNDRYVHGANIMIRDVLLNLDLPQVAAAVAPRELTLAAPVDHMRRRVPLAIAERAWRVAVRAYQEAGVGGR